MTLAGTGGFQRPRFGQRRTSDEAVAEAERIKNASRDWEHRGGRSQRPQSPQWHPQSNWPVAPPAAPAQPPSRQPANVPPQTPQQASTEPERPVAQRTHPTTDQIAASSGPVSQPTPPRPQQAAPPPGPPPSPQPDPAEASPDGENVSGSGKWDALSDVTIPAPEPMPGEPGDGEPVKNGSKRRMKKVKDTKTGTTFDVPAAGSRIKDPRRANVRVLTAVVVSTVLLTSTFAAILIAALSGQAQEAARAPLAAADVDRYHLDSYDTTAAAAFGQAYVQQCLTRTGNKETEQQRMTMLEALAVNDDPMCAGDTTGTSRDEDLPVRIVLSTTFAGTAGSGENQSRTRYLWFDVLTNDNMSARYTVPVYLDDPATGAGPRVAGPMGVLPLPGLSEPKLDDPKAADKAATDSELAAQWRGTLMPEFMEAWMGSTPALEQYLSDHATEAARTGLGGMMTDPVVDEITAVADPESADVDDGEITYREGAQVTATVAVTASPASNPDTTVASTYRLHLVRSGTVWLVRSVEGAAVAQPRGGNDAPKRGSGATPATPTPGSETTTDQSDVPQQAPGPATTPEEGTPAPHATP